MPRIAQATFTTSERVQELFDDAGIIQTESVDLISDGERSCGEARSHRRHGSWKELRRDADRQRQLRRIGLIPQDFGLLPSWTPRRTLEQDLRDAQVPAEQREARGGQVSTRLALAISPIVISAPFPVGSASAWPSPACWLVMSS